jgi:hypothetical protein
MNAGTSKEIWTPPPTPAPAIDLGKSRHDSYSVDHDHDHDSGMRGHASDYAGRDAATDLGGRSTHPPTHSARASALFGYIQDGTP